MPPLLEARALHKSYGAVQAVRGVSFEVAAGTCFGLLGPNGAGKTTTVEMLEGITKPSSGEALYRGRRLGRRFRQEAGIQFQSTALQDFLTVRETLELFRRLYRTPSPLALVVEMCVLGGLLERDTRTLSGGQRQRLLLALALINDPAVLFLDEPTTGLDPQARRGFWTLLEAIKRRGKTIVLTTHYMEEAYRLCDEIAILDDGRIIAHGSPQALLSAHFDETILVLPRDHLPRPGTPPPGIVRHDAGDSVELVAADLNAALGWLLGAGADLNGLRVRNPTLEDLFLALTGEELRA